MRKRTRGRLVTAIFAAGLVGGTGAGQPICAGLTPRSTAAAGADRSGRGARAAAGSVRCRRRRPIRSPPPSPSGRVPPAAAGGSAGARRRPIRSRRRRPTRSAAAQPTRDPARARRPARTRRHTPGQPVFAPPTFNPIERLRWPEPPSRSTSTSQRPIADRADGRAGDPHLVGPASAGPVLLDERQPGALAAAGLLAREAPSSTSTQAAPSRALPFPSSLVATIDDATHQMTVST